METKTNKAFISYKHGRASNFSKALAEALSSYAIGLFERPRSIFRDEDYIAAGEKLPEVIERALSDSEYLILLASQEAAKSVWVQLELETWCTKLGRADKLIILHTEGDIASDDNGGKILWEKTNALPEMLIEHITSLPLYIDVRDLISNEVLTLEVTEFKDTVNRIVARFLGVKPIEMSGKAYHTYKRNRRLKITTYSVISASIIAAILIGVLTFDRVQIANAFEDYNTPPNKKSQAQREAIKEECARIRMQPDTPLRPPSNGGQADVEAVQKSCEPLNKLGEKDGGIADLSDEELVRHLGIQWTYNDGGARSSYLTARILNDERPYEALVFYVQSHNLNHKDLAGRRPQCALLKLGRKKTEEAFCKHSDQKP